MPAELGKFLSTLPPPRVCCTPEDLHSILQAQCSAAMLLTRFLIESKHMPESLLINLWGHSLWQGVRAYIQPRERQQLFLTSFSNLSTSPLQWSILPLSSSEERTRRELDKLRSFIRDFDDHDRLLPFRFWSLRMPLWKQLWMLS